MDHENMSDLKDLAPNQCKAKCLLLGTFHPNDKATIIRDPYYVMGKFIYLVYKIILIFLKFIFFFRIVDQKVLKNVINNV